MAVQTINKLLEATVNVVEIIPAPVGVDLYAKMKDIASQYGLRKHINGSSTELSADGKRFALNFDHPIAAHTFMMRLNQDPESDYTAIQLKIPIGLDAYTLVERI